MKKEITEEIARNKAEAYCASAERCISEVERKLYQWGASKESVEKIICHLLDEDFINEKRYASAFVRDKYRFNAWGRMKITLSLRQKGISDNLIDEALKEIDENVYQQTLKTLLDQKGRSMKANSDFEKKGKIVRFALSRGFLMSEILLFVHLDDNEKALENME